MLVSDHESSLAGKACIMYVSKKVKVRHAVRSAVRKMIEIGKVPAGCPVLDLLDMAATFAAVVSQVQVQLGRLSCMHPTAFPRCTLPIGPF